jgi:hypothetical protein
MPTTTKLEAARAAIAAHTPGPWEAEPVELGTSERPWVGRLAEHQYSALACGNDQAEAIANARLIAAAPELLAALQLFVEGYDPDKEYTDSDLAYIIFGDKARIALAAIAKAVQS